MASVWVSARDLNEGKFPGVCAKSGEPADGMVGVKFGTTPGWTWILLLFGIFPFLIAAYFAQLRAQGLLPMSAAALARARSYSRWQGASIWASLAFFGLAVVQAARAQTSTPFLAVGCLLLGTALVLSLFDWVYWPSGKVDGQRVLLLHVHQRFVDAVEAARLP